MSVRGYMILVADDEQAIRRNIEKTLENEGYTVTTVGNAEEALQEINQHSFDLIILDIKMPDAMTKLAGRAGVDVLQKIRAKGLTVPIIMISATRDNELIHEIMNYHDTRFFIKDDFGSKELIKTVKEFLI